MLVYLHGPTRCHDKIAVRTLLTSPVAPGQRMLSAFSSMLAAPSHFHISLHLRLKAVGLQTPCPFWCAHGLVFPSVWHHPHHP